MNWKEYAAQFPNEIGRTVMRDLNQHHVYHINDAGEVGVWITNIRTTCGEGKQLFGDDAAAAIAWCQQQKPWTDKVKQQRQEMMR